jgi:hypothetical protein
MKNGQTQKFENLDNFTVHAKHRCTTDGTDELVLRHICWLLAHHTHRSISARVGTTFLITFRLAVSLSTTTHFLTLINTVHPNPCIDDEAGENPNYVDSSDDEDSYSYHREEEEHPS